MSRPERALTGTGARKEGTWRKTLLERLADIDEQLSHPFYQEPDVLASRSKSRARGDRPPASEPHPDELSEPLAMLIRQLEPEHTDANRRLLLPAIAGAMGRCRISRSVHQCAILSLSLCLTGSLGFAGAVFFSADGIRGQAAAHASNLPPSVELAMYDSGEGAELPVKPETNAPHAAVPVARSLAGLHARLGQRKYIKIAADVSRSSEFALPLNIEWPDASRANAELRITGLPQGLFPTIGEQPHASAVSLPLSDLPLLRLLSNNDTPKAFDLELVVEDKAAQLEEWLTVTVDLHRREPQPIRTNVAETTASPGPVTANRAQEMKLNLKRQTEIVPPAGIAAPAPAPAAAAVPVVTGVTETSSISDSDRPRRVSRKLSQTQRMAVGRAPEADDTAAAASRPQRPRPRPASPADDTQPAKPDVAWWQKPQPEWAPWKH